MVDVALAFLISSAQLPRNSLVVLLPVGAMMLPISHLSGMDGKVLTEIAV